MATFLSILEANQYAASEAVVVCRGNTTVARLTGRGGNVGRGATGHFARAAVLRDRNGDIAEAFACSVNAVLRLLNNPPEVLRRDLLGSPEGEDKTLRHLLWVFLRSPATGLPPATLAAKAKWQPLLKQRVDSLLDAIEARTTYLRSASWTRSLTVAELPETPLWQVNLLDKGASGIRVDTVHQVKGEGIPVVLYVAKTADLTKLIEGARTEVGRIGYVAVTRAKDLLFLGVPKTAGKPLVAELEAKGFRPWID